jgi:hypothetical protein
MSNQPASNAKLAAEAIERIEWTLKRVAGAPNIQLDETQWAALVAEFNRHAHEPRTDELADARKSEAQSDRIALHWQTIAHEAIRLLQEWGTTYGDPRFPSYPPYGDRIREFLDRVCNGGAGQPPGVHQIAELERFKSEAVIRAAQLDVCAKNFDSRDCHTMGEACRRAGEILRSFAQTKGSAP